MHLIKKPSSRPSTTAWPDTHLCCEWSSYGTHTTFSCPYLASWCCYFIEALIGCLGLPCLGFVLCSMVLGHLSLAFDSQNQSLGSSVWILSILAVYQYVLPSEEMSKNYSSSWMYLCRQLWYFITKCFFKSLIANFVRRVWNKFVSSCTSWFLCCRSVVHCMYLSS